MSQASRIHQRSIMRMTYCVLCLLALPNISKASAGSGGEGLHVGLQRYYNQYNLKYIPDKGTTPYCCCGNGNYCFESTRDSNLTTRSCMAQCMLRFTLCAEVPPEPPFCYRSAVETAPPLVVFDECLSSSSFDFFPDQDMALNFIFPLDGTQKDDLEHLKLSIIIEEEDLNGFDVVDKIDLPLPTCAYTESEAHTGINGIATIRLGYSFVSLIDQSVTSDVRLACPTRVVTVTKTVEKRVTVDALESSSPQDAGSECAESGSSSSIFAQAALPLLAVAVVLIVATMVIIATALILIRRKKAAVAKCEKEDNGSWNATYAKQDVPYTGPSGDKNISVFGNQAYQAFSFSDSQTGTTETSGFSLVANSTYERNA